MPGEPSEQAVPGEPSEQAGLADRAGRAGRADSDYATPSSDARSQFDIADRRIPSRMTALCAIDAAIASAATLG